MKAVRLKNLPVMESRAQRLLRRCLGMICLYLLLALCYGFYFFDLPKTPAFVLEMLRSAYIAAVIAFGGAVVLDWDIRASKRTGR